MTYDEFIQERRRLNNIADDLYSADNFPGSKAWLAHNAAEVAAKAFKTNNPDHMAEMKLRSDAAKLAPVPSVLADRISRGVD